MENDYDFFVKNFTKYLWNNVDKGRFWIFLKLFPWNFPWAGVPPICQNNKFFEKNILWGKKLEYCLKCSETWKKNNKICFPNYGPPPPLAHIMGKIMGFRGLQDGCQWKCSNSAKIWAWNFWYHTQCVSGRLDHKTDFLKNCWKKINYFPREGGGGTPPWKIPWK